MVSHLCFPRFRTSHRLDSIGMFSSYFYVILGERDSNEAIVGNPLR